MRLMDCGYSYIFTPKQPIARIAFVRGKDEREKIISEGFVRVEVPSIFNLNVAIYCSDSLKPKPPEEIVPELKKQRGRKPKEDDEATIHQGQHYTILELKGFWRDMNKDIPLKEKADIISGLSGCTTADAKELISIFEEEREQLCQTSKKKTSRVRKKMQ